MKTNITFSMSAEFKAQLTQAAIEEGLPLSQFIVKQLGGPAPPSKIEKKEVEITVPIYMLDFWNNQAIAVELTLSQYIAEMIKNFAGLPDCFHTYYEDMVVRHGDVFDDGSEISYTPHRKHARRWSIYHPSMCRAIFIHEHLSTVTTKQRLFIPVDVLKVWKSEAQQQSKTLSDYLVDMSVQPDMMSVH